MPCGWQRLLDFAAIILLIIILAATVSSSYSLGGEASLLSDLGLSIKNTSDQIHRQNTTNYRTQLTVIPTWY